MSFNPLNKSEYNKSINQFITRKNYLCSIANTQQRT